MFRRAYKALETELGPFGSELERLDAARTAVAWVNLEVATRELMEARRHSRRLPKGTTRPRHMEKLSKRQALNDGSYTTALDRLRATVERRRQREDAGFWRRPQGQDSAETSQS